MKVNVTKVGGMHSIMIHMVETFVARAKYLLEAKYFLEKGNIIIVVRTFIK